MVSDVNSKLHSNVHVHALMTISKLAIVFLLYVNREVFLHVHVCSDMVVFSLVLLKIVTDLIMFQHTLVAETFCSDI